MSMLTSSATTERSFLPDTFFAAIHGHILARPVGVILGDAGSGDEYLAYFRR
jgi:hypothetical protein